MNKYFLLNILQICQQLPIKFLYLNEMLMFIALSTEHKSVQTRG